MRRAWKRGFVTSARATAAAPSDACVVLPDWRCKPTQRCARARLRLRRNSGHLIRARRSTRTVLPPPRNRQPFLNSKFPLDMAGGGGAAQVDTAGAVQHCSSSRPALGGLQQTTGTRGLLLCYMLSGVRCNVFWSVLSVVCCGVATLSVACCLLRCCNVVRCMLSVACCLLRCCPLQVATLSVATLPVPCFVLSVVCCNAVRSLSSVARRTFVFPLRRCPSSVAALFDCRLHGAWRLL